MSFKLQGNLPFANIVGEGGYVNGWDEEE